MPEPASALPPWARRCIAAGALLLLLPVAGVVAGAHWVRQATDADLQWARLARALPLERQPEGVKIVGLAPPFIDARAWLASDRSRGLQLVWIETEAAPSLLPALRAGSGAARLRVQGLELPLARWTSGARADELPGGPVERRFLAALLGALEGRPGSACAAVDLDAARAGARGALVLLVSRLAPVPGVVDLGSKRRDLAEPIEDAELQGVLAAFDIGG